MSKYIAPTWMHQPSSEWSLDEIKGGIVVNTYPLHDSLILFGRSPITESEFKTSTFITTAHESCSRLHARIAFDKSGSPWLRDLGSANKTMVNKRSLPIKSVGKTENLPGEGGRGVMLFPGDVIQFGASTRLYVLNGPSEFDAGAVKARLAASAASTKANGSNSHPSVSQNAAPFLKEQAISSAIHTNLSENEDLDDIPNQHRKLYDKIQVKKMKLANTQHEKQILSNKSVMMELSSGQAKQLETLETREEHLLKELQELEESLRDQLDQSEKTNSSSTKRRREDEDVDYNDSDDDFYDKTKRSHKSNNDEEESIETVDSLLSKGIKLFSRLKGEKERVKGMERKMLGIQRNLDLVEKSPSTSDDFFFLKNDLEIAKQEQTKTLESVQSIEEEIKSLTQVLSVVSPDTIVDLDAHFIGSKAEYESFIKKRDETFRMPPPMIPSKVMAMDPPPARKVYGPSKCLKE